MASIYTRGNILWIKYLVQGELVRESLKLKDSPKNREQAQKKLNQIELNVQQNLIKPEKKLKPLHFDEATLILFTRKGFNQKNKRMYELAFDSFRKVCGNPKIKDISNKHYLQFRNYLLENRAYSTAATYVNYLRIFFNFLKDEELYRDKNPFKRLKEKPKTIVSIPDDHFEQIFNYFTENDKLELYRFIRFLYLTGFRLNEALQFTWEQVRFDENIILVQNFKDNRIDIFPLYKELKEFLESFRKEQGKLFRYKARHALKLFQNSLKALNLPRYTIHDIRRTFASRYAVKLTPVELKAIMRHRDIKTTLAHYISLDIKKIGEKL
ncbi:MAG TPA: tyrosine-type recombinase/integrase [Ignavibacteriales bacterium]|nr:tyrosine-type recombinase/integrase [Ignavibacteriales bacterium]